MAFYDKYKTLCERAGSSATGVAVELGISRAAVARWKREGTIPKIEILQRLATKFGVSVEYFLSEDSSETTFYDRFSKLCERKGVSPTRAAVEAGIAKSAVTNWKQKGGEPTGENAKKLCAYFGVTRSELFDDTPTDTPPKDEDLKFALFGGGDVTDAQFEEVKRFAQFVRERDKDKKGG